MSLPTALPLQQPLRPMRAHLVQNFSTHDSVMTFRRYSAIFKCRYSAIFSDQLLVQETRNMDPEEIHEDAEPCPSREAVCALTHAVRPKGSDWPGLLGVDIPDNSWVCRTCSRRISALRRTARKRAATDMELTPEQAAVQPSAGRSGDGWGTSSQDRRCVLLDSAGC